MMRRAREAELAEFREAAHLDTNGTPWARSELVWILAISPEPRLRNPAEALEHARKAVEITRGEHPAFQTTLALAAYRSGLYEEALAALDKVKALGGTEDATHWFLLAMIRGQEGKKTGAPLVRQGGRLDEGPELPGHVPSPALDRSRRIAWPARARRTIVQ